MSQVTFRSPRAWGASCGFGAGEHRLREMLAGADISAPRVRAA